MKPQTQLSLLIALAVSVGQVQSVDDTVQFGADGGADVVSTDQDLSSMALGTFSAGANLASTVTYGTTPPTPTSLNVATSSTATARNAEVDDIGTNRDAINVLYDYLSALNGMVVWEDFPAGIVNSFETNIQSNGSGDIFTNPAAGCRYLIQKKTTGNWYVSDQVHTFSNNNYFGGGVTTSAASLNWFAFTPHSAGSAVIGASASIDMTDIDSVGMYFQVFGDGTGTLGTRLRYFKANLTAGGNTEPTVAVTAPADGTTVTSGTNVNFTGTATDNEDGDLSASLSWNSSIDGNLGSGANISTSALSVGTHTITASVTDSGSLPGSDSITLTVNTNGGGGPGSGDPSNVIVIISDDAGYADFSFMDGLSGEISQVPTPHLDALADRGVRFARAYVAANCQPTRAAIATGAYQQRIGNESVGNDLFLSEDVYEGVPVETDTIWDRMKSLGYSTGAIGKWHLGQTEDTPQRIGNRPQNQGIDEFYGMWHGSRDYTVGTYNRNAVDDPEHALQPRFIREALVHPDGSKTDTVVEYSKFVDVPAAPKYITNIFGQYAVDFVKAHHDDPEPFFLYVAHPAPHKPWTDESPDIDDPRINGGPKPDGGNYPTLVGYRRQVASMMITMDKEIGRLMQTLEDPNGDMDTSDSITDETLVIFINDNGGVVGKDAANGDVNGTDNGKLQGFKGSSHDGGIRVPMILAGAGLDPSKHGSVYYRPVHGVDILPTAVAAASGTLNPTADKIDGVNLLPFLNGTNTATPHDFLVHKWRGSFAVIKGDWKLQNSRNISADPMFYELFKMTDGDVDADVGETTDVIDVPANASLVAELKRALTDHEAFFDKPRYAIRSNTLETEPLNIFDHHVFRPGLHDDWSGGADIQVDPVTGTRNWHEAGTTNQKFLFNTDAFAGAILEFPVFASDYVANNGYRRKTGMEYMLNKIILSGDFSAGANRTATISGSDLLFTNDLSGNAPKIAVDATKSGSFDFTYDIGLNLVLYHDLTVTGDGAALLAINGDVSQYFASRGLNKTGSCTAAVNGARTYSGDTTVDAGILTLGQANPTDDASSVSIAAAGATLDLAFPGTDVVAKLFIGGVQQEAGVYEAIGNPGAGNEIPQITGQGTLTVTSDPVGYSLWSNQNAPGQPFDGDHDSDSVLNGIEYFMGESGNSFTALPPIDSAGNITWPIGDDYLGSYGDDYRLEISPNLADWMTVAIGDVSIIPGDFVAYTLPTDLAALFVRLSVDPK